MAQSDVDIVVTFAGKLNQAVPPQLLPNGRAFTEILNLRRNREGELENRKTFKKALPNLPNDGGRPLKIWSSENGHLLGMTTRAVYSLNPTQMHWTKLVDRTNQRLNVFSITQKERDIKNLGITDLKRNNNLLIVYTFDNEIFFKVFNTLENRVIGREERISVSGLSDETITGLAVEEIGSKIWLGILTSKRLLRTAHTILYEDERGLGGPISAETTLAGERNVRNLQWRLEYLPDSNRDIVEENIKNVVFDGNRLWYQRSNGSVVSVIIDFAHHRTNPEDTPSNVNRVILDPTADVTDFTNRRVFGFKVWNEFSFAGQNFKLIWSEQTGYFLLNDQNVLVGHYFANLVPITTTDPPRMQYYGRAIEKEGKIYIPVFVSGQIEVGQGSTLSNPLGVKLLCFDFNSRIPPSIAQLGSQVIIGGPVLSYFDDQGVSEHGFTERPNIQKTDTDDYDKWAYSTTELGEDGFPVHELPEIEDITPADYAEFGGTLVKKDTPYMVKAVGWTAGNPDIDGTWDANTAQDRVLRFGTKTSDGTPDGAVYGTFTSLKYNSTRQAVEATFVITNPVVGNPEGILVNGVTPFLETMYSTYNQATREFKIFHYTNENPFTPGSKYQIEIPSCEVLGSENLDQTVQAADEDNDQLEIKVDHAFLRRFKRRRLANRPRIETSVGDSPGAITYAQLNTLGWQGGFTDSQVRDDVGVPSGTASGSITNPDIINNIKLGGVFKRGELGSRSDTTKDVRVRFTGDGQSQYRNLAEEVSSLCFYNNEIWGFDLTSGSSRTGEQPRVLVFKASAVEGQRNDFSRVLTLNDTFGSLNKSYVTGFVADNKIWIIARPRTGNLNRSGTRRSLSSTEYDLITYNISNGNRINTIRIQTGSVSISKFVTDGTRLYIEGYVGSRKEIYTASATTAGGLANYVFNLPQRNEISMFLSGDTFYVARPVSSTIIVTEYNKTTLAQTGSKTYQNLIGVHIYSFYISGDSIFINTAQSSLNVDTEDTTTFLRYEVPDDSPVTGVGRNLNLVLTAPSGSFTQTAFDTEIKNRIAKIKFIPKATGTSFTITLSDVPTANITRFTKSNTRYQLYNLETFYTTSSLLRTLVDSGEFSVEFRTPSGNLFVANDTFLTPTIFSTYFNTNKDASETLIRRDIIGLNPLDRSKTNNFVLPIFQEIEGSNMARKYYYRRTRDNPLSVREDVFSFVMPLENILFRYVLINLRPTREQELAAHVYFYLCRFKWLDENGLEFRSPVSNTFPLFTNNPMGVANNQPTLQVSHLNLTNKRGGVSIEVYRTQDRLPTYQFLKEVTNIVGEESTVITDDVLDENLGAVLDPQKITVSGAENLITYRNRFVLYGFPQSRNRFVVSSKLRPLTNIGVTFLRANQAGDAFEIRMASPINAIAQLDQSLIIFCEDGVYLWTIKENSLTQNEPQKVTSLSNLTAVSPLSVNESVGGLFLITPFRGIWELGRNLSSFFAGEAIQNFKGKAIEQPIRLEDTEEERWITDDEGNFPLIAHDYRHDDWFVDNLEPGAKAISHTIHKGKYLLLVEKSGNSVILSEVDENPDVVRRFVVKTGWLNFGYVQSVHRIRDVRLLADIDFGFKAKNPGKIILEIEINYKDGVKEILTHTPSAPPPPGTYDSSSNQYRFQFRNQEVTAMRLKWIITAKSVKLFSMLFKVNADKSLLLSSIQR